MAQEKTYENKIKRYLKSVGVYPLGTAPDKMDVKPVGYYEKRWGGGTFTKSGLPDLHIVIKGVALDVEVKAQTGNASELQKEMIDQIRNSGSLAFIVYPSGWPKLKSVINGLLIDKFNREECTVLK